PGAPELDMDARLLAVAVREPDERRLQAQIVQDCGPEVEGEVVHATQQLDGELPSPGQAAVGSLRREAVVSFQRQLEPGEDLTDLVVQLPCDPPTLALLGLEDHAGVS